MKKRESEEKFQELYNANQLLGTRLENVKKELAKYQAENTMLLEKNAELEKTLSSVKDTIQVLKEHLDAMEEKNLRLERELESTAACRQTLASSEEALAAAQAEAQTLSMRCTELEAAAADADALREKCRELSEQCEQQAAEIASLHRASEAAGQVMPLPVSAAASGPVAARQPADEGGPAEPRMHVLFRESERPAVENLPFPATIDVLDSCAAAQPFLSCSAVPKSEADPFPVRQHDLPDTNTPPAPLEKPQLQEYRVPDQGAAPSPAAYSSIEKAASLIADAHTLAAGIITEAQSQAQRVAAESNRQAELLKNQIRKYMSDMESFLRDWNNGEDR